MEIKKYNVIVTQRNDEEIVFSYNIIPSPITELWEKASLPAINDNRDIIHFSHINCSDTPQDTLDEINYHCDIINTEGILTIPYIPKSIENCTQEFLNQLHKTFHAYTEEAIILESKSDEEFKILPTRESLLIVNDLIHELDHLEIDEGTSFNMVKMNFENDHEYEQYFSEDLYQYFNYSWGVMGDLRLGYATLGKTLHACYVENDMNVIKEKMVRPQIRITSEVYLIFDKSTEEYQKTTGAQLYQKWCKNNNVYEYGYDPHDLQHKYTGRPLLGKLNTEVDINFIKDKWCGYKSVGVEIE
mgnify:CR=1 FL=1